MISAYMFTAVAVTLSFVLFLGNLLGADRRAVPACCQ